MDKVGYQSEEPESHDRERSFDRKAVRIYSSSQFMEAQLHMMPCGPASCMDGRAGGVAALGRWAPRFPPGFPGAGSQVRVRRAPPAVSTTKDEPERWAPGRSLQTRQPALREIQAFQVDSGETGFPDGSDGEESACKARDLGSIPGSGRSPGEGNDNPLQYSCL